MRFVSSLVPPESRDRIKNEMTDEEIVKTIHPNARVVQSEEWMAYHRFSIHSQTGIFFRLGGGPTHEEAWRNSRIHMGVLRD